MLKTALKPRWIAALFLALVLSSVFVLLSQWQFSSAQEETTPPSSNTEKVRPLTEVFEPGVPMLVDTADQMVSLSGQYLAGTQVLVQDRLQNGESGYWVVNAFQVDGAPVLQGAGGGPPVIPIARGWIEKPADAPPAPEGELALTGRLIPAEAPIAQRPVEGQVPSLAVAELINRWDVASYAGFVVAERTTSAGEIVGAGVGPGLEKIVVGPQPQAAEVNWLNIFYAAEWVVFAGFAIFLWWRLVADDYRRGLEDEEDNALNSEVMT